MKKTKLHWKLVQLLTSAHRPSIGPAARSDPSKCMHFLVFFMMFPSPLFLTKDTRTRKPPRPNEISLQMQIITANRRRSLGQSLGI